MAKHIEEFQKLNIRVTDIPEEHRIDVFRGTLKDNIQHEVCVWEPDSLEKEFRLVLTGKFVRPTVGDLPGRKSQLDLEPFGVGIPSGVWV